MPTRKLSGKLAVRVSCIFLLLAIAIKTVQGIRCYECLERPKSHEKHLACSSFDSSPRYQTDCEYSTYCMKRISKLRLHNGTYISVYVHKCADQAQKTVVEDEMTGQWSWGKIVHKFIYNDGCFPHPTHFMLATETSDCFCSTDLCNNSVQFRGSFPILLAAISCVLVLW